MIFSKCNPFFSIHFLTRRTKMVTNLWQSWKGFSVLPQKSQLSAPQYSKMSSHAVHPSRITKNGNLGTQESDPDYSNSRDGRWACWRLFQQHASRSSPERRKDYGHWPYLAWATGFNERLGQTSLPEISKSDQEQQHNDRCWLLLLLCQFQREKGQWCRECPSPHMQWPSCHGAPSHKLHTFLNFQENINRAKNCKISINWLSNTIAVPSNRRCA